MHIGKNKQYSLLMIEGEVTTKWMIWSDPSSNDPKPHHSINISNSIFKNQSLNWKFSSISLLEFLLLKHLDLCSIYRSSVGCFAINKFQKIGNTCFQSCRFQMDTWIQAWHMWTLLEGIGQVEIPKQWEFRSQCDQCTCECREVLCRAALHGASCKPLRPLSAYVGELSYAI